jgi:hypothetical protein
MYKVADGNDDHPLVKFNRTYFDQGKSALEIMDESVMPSIDNVVREFIFYKIQRLAPNELSSYFLDHGEEEEGQAKVYVLLGLNSTKSQVGNTVTAQKRPRL